MVPSISRHSLKPSGIPIAKKASSTLPAYTPSIRCSKAAKSDVAHSLRDKPLDPEAKSKLQAELEGYFREWRRSLHGRMTKYGWTSLPHLMFRLESPLAPPSAIDYWNIRYFCNKPTALYWATTAQVNDDCPMLPYGCIYKQWYRYYHNQPSLDFGHFFANPIQITATGPETITDIIRAHKCLCDQASSFLSLVAKGKAHHESWPNPQHYKLLPVYRAAFILLDNRGLDSVEEEPDCYVLDEEIQRQNALIVLTGDESGLSAPVTFESIRAQSLSIERNDTTTYGDVQVIRVSLLTAVRFIIDLEQREEAAFPSPYIATDRSMSPHTDNISFGTITATEWVDEIFQKIDDKGIANVQEATLAMQKLEAREQGQSHEVEFTQFSLRWK